VPKPTGCAPFATKRQNLFCTAMRKALASPLRRSAWWKHRDAQGRFVSPQRTRQAVVGIARSATGPLAANRSPASTSKPLSTTVLVSSSMNDGPPSVRSMIWSGQRLATSHVRDRLSTLPGWQTAEAQQSHVQAADPGKPPSARSMAVARWVPAVTERLVVPSPRSCRPHKWT